MTGKLALLRARGRWTRAAALAGCLWLTACKPSVLNPGGPVSLAERTILIDALAIMLAIVVPTIAAAIAFAWWYREGNPRARRRPDFVYSGSIEMVVWAIPLMVITLLGGVTWIGSHQLDPAQPLPSDKPPLDVQVVSLDWKWLFIYPDQHVASVNRLVIPAGVPVHFSITSASVMTAFFIPQLGSMIYAMHGMTTQLHLQADAPGTFYGEASHFSGDGFSGMHFDTDAVPPDRFAAWVEQTRAAGPVLDDASYAKLARQSQDVAPFTYRAVEPRLFNDIAMQVIPPAPGPQVGQAGVDVSPRSEH